MVDHRDLLIELRDGEKCVEARFLRGERGGFRVVGGEGKDGWLPFAGDPGTHAHLVETGRDFRNHPGVDELIEHGIALWDSFDPAHRTTLLELRRNAKDPISRVSLRIAPAVVKPFDASGPIRTARDLWRSMAWECLLDKKPEDAKPKAKVQTFFLGGSPSVDWALRRVVDAAKTGERRRLPKAPIRILVLLTSLYSDDAEMRKRLLDSAIEAIPKLRGVFSGDREIDLKVAGSRCDLERHEDGRWYLPDSQVAVDLDYGTDEDLERLFATAEETTTQHAILFFGHSDAEKSHPFHPKADDALARKLRFRLQVDGEDRTVELALDLLGKWLANHPLEFVASLNCASSALAEPLLELAPDVIATSALVPGLTMASFVVGLLKGLRDDELLSTAFVIARNALPTVESRPLVVQLSRTLDDVSFLGPDRRAVAKYHERLQRKHGMLALPDQSRRTAELERVHVQLALRRPEENETWVKTRDAFDHERASETLSFEELLQDKNRCWVLRGVAGAGKTTTLRRCALEPQEDRFPIYVSLPTWLSESDARRTDFGDLSEVLASIAAEVGVPSLDQTIQTIAVRGLGRQHGLRVVFLLDAFDELDEKQRENATLAAKTLAVELKECAVVISSRETAEIDVGKHLGEGWETARLLPLDARRQRELVLAWHRAEDRAKKGTRSDEELAPDADAALSKILAGGPRMHEFAGNPLLLTLLTNLQLDEPKRRFDVGLHDVMRTITDRLLRGEWLRNQPRPNQRIRDKDLLRVLLRALCWDMLHRKDGSPRHVLDDTELLAWLGDVRAHPALAAAAERLKDNKRMNCSLADIPRPLAEESPFGPEDPRRMRHWTFTHNLLQEALCAEHWWFEILKEDGSDAAVKQAIDQLRARMSERKDALDFWTEPTALLAGWMGNDKIVVELLKHEDTLDLGLRAMGAVGDLRPETVEKVLALLPEWNFDADRASEGKKGPRVEAYEVIARQMRGKDVEAVTAMAKVLLDRAGVK